MAAPWPPQYGQVPHQIHTFNTSQQPNGQYQASQPVQRPYPYQVYGQPQSQPPYEQQPSQFAQQAVNFTGYSQQHPSSSNCPQQQPAYPMPTAQQYQYGPPQPQQQSHQGFNPPPSTTSSMPPYTQAPHTPGAQPQQYNQGQFNQQVQQPFAPQQPSYSPTQWSHQQQQIAKASTPQKHQYGPPPSSTPDQVSGPPASSDSGQPQEKKPTVPCFNCGSFEHWAVSCPEPLREVPAGIANRQTQQPPAKRQKFNAPIITKYQVPSHLAQAQTPTQAQPSPYAHTGFAQIQTAYPVPPTPISAQSPPSGQWPPTVPYPHQQPPHTGYPSQAHPYPPHQYTYVSTPPTSAHCHGPSPASQMSPQKSYQPSSGNPTYSQLHHQQQQQQQHHKPSTAQSYSGPSPFPALSSSAGAYTPQQPHGQQPASGINHGDHPLPTPSVHSQVPTPKPHPVEPQVTDDGGDDLSKLDVPEFPVAQDGPKPTLVGRPLPTNFVVADALAPFDPPALGDQGRCKSKYNDRPDVGDESRNIKDTAEWEKHQTDPIFNTIASGGNVILLSVLDMIYRPTRLQDMSEDTEANHGDQTDNSPSEADHTKEPVLPLGSPTNERRILSPSDSEQQIRQRQISPSNSPHDSDSKVSPKEALTSLDDTREPGHVKVVPRPCPPPTPKDRMEDNDRSSRSRSASPRKPESNSYQTISPPDSGADGRRRNEDFSIERRQSYYGEESSRRWNDKPNTHRFQRVPPPPPPPARRPSLYDGTGGSPFSPESIHVNPSGSGPDSNVHNGNGASYNYYAPNEYVPSPARLRAERSYSHKREYGNREESSDEDETTRRRQADDVTPKQKRRQPKVADAYSRRW